MKIPSIQEYLRFVEIFKRRPRRFLSFDFGQSFLKLAYLESSGSNLALLNYGLQEISREADRKATVDFIHQFIHSNSIAAKDAYVTISEPEAIFIKHLVLPKVPREEIREAIKWQLKEESQLNLEDTLLDWQIVKEYSDAEGARKNEIVCVLVLPEVVQKYLSLISDCQLNPVMVSVGPFNYSHILSCLSDTPAVAAVLDLSYEVSQLCIYHNCKLNFIRNLALSANRLIAPLIDSWIAANGQSGFCRDKAREIIRNFAIPLEAVSDNPSAVQIISAMRPALETLVSELEHSFGYFSSHFKEAAPSLLYIAGGGANLKNLDGYLGRELGIKVSKLPFPDGVSTLAIDPERLDRDQPQLVNALGAALAGPTSINLLPLEVKARKIESLGKTYLKFITITLSAILLLLWSMVRFQTADYKKRLMHAKMHLKVIEGISGLNREIESRERLIKKIVINRLSAPWILKKISAIAPQNLVLTEMNLDFKNYALTLEGKVVSGALSPEETLTDFMKTVEDSAFFADTALVFSKNVSDGQEFEIKCNLAH